MYSVYPEFLLLTNLLTVPLFEVQFLLFRIGTVCKSQGAVLKSKLSDSVANMLWV
jgi:hypothetical protein